ncbi:redoxin family protein [Pedobacter sp. L105]|uniref:redoxin family protein n=1 Tax=Pedobacter sp. L105 TaxID=1641871 RepID=UPI00131D4585|nr:redoxin family protein [Pedobacter sp. L105]
MKKLITFILLAAACSASAQQLINTGDQFPAISIGPLINAPVHSFSISEDMGNRFYILNLWGTWCTPCIPEMDALAKLQDVNPNTLQIIAISDDSPERLKKYLIQKPSKIWLASDTSDFFYHAFGLVGVGQSAIINSKHEVVAMVKTDSINQQMITDLVKGKKIKSTANLKEQTVSGGKDLFGVDSTMTEDFTLRGYMKGQRSVGQTYLDAPYFGRRISFVNSCITTFYKEAYLITSSQQIIYEINEKEACNFDDKSSLYCLDLLVKPEEKDSLYRIMQKKLQVMLPVKARLTEKLMPVYVLKLNPAKQLSIPISASQKLSYEFGGRGFNGTGVSAADFATIYLSNEYDLPVVDETGLTGRYDIHTVVDIRNLKNITQSISDLGFMLEKEERKMKVLVLYK